METLITCLVYDFIGIIVCVLVACFFVCRPWPLDRLDGSCSSAIYAHVANPTPVIVVLFVLLFLFFALLTMIAFTAMPTKFVTFFVFVACFAWYLRKSVKEVKNKTTTSGASIL